MICNHEYERHVLGGLLKFPDSFGIVAPYLDESDFHSEDNRVIFSVIRTSLNNMQHIDKVILTERVRLLGVGFKSGLSAGDYINSLSLNSSTEKSLLQAVKDLKVVTRRREYAEVCELIKKQMITNGNMSYEQINAYVDKTLYSKMSSWYDTGDFVDLFETMYDRVEERGNNPVEEAGYKTPYANFNRYYGGLVPGELYVFCARPGNGKTTFLDSTAFQISNILSKPKIPVLILDTEMMTETIQDRMFSSLTNINPWYFTTGQWRQVPEFVPLVRMAGERIKKEKFRMDHKYIINKGLDQVLNNIKRWYYTKVGRGSPCLIVYDYLKINEAASESNKEFQIIGNYLTRLKDMVGKEVKAPLLTAAQLNRDGENRSASNQQIRDDSGVISMSDRISWYASFVAIFRQKGFQEHAEEGVEFGTHKLIVTKERLQGRDAQGHFTFIKDHYNKITRNFLNFNVRNFNVEEVGCAKEMFDALRKKSPPKTKTPVADPMNDHNGD